MREELKARVRTYFSFVDYVKIESPLKALIYRCVHTFCT